MSSREVLQRIADVRRRRQWRRRVIGWSDRDEDGPLWTSSGIRARLAAAAAFPPVLDSLDRLTSGRLSFLGRDWPPIDCNDPGNADVWRHDPVGGRLWRGADTSSFDIDVRSTSEDCAAPGTLGDVKFVWEPNRLQILHPIAVSLANGTASAGPAAFAILRHWAAGNPPYAGINWVSGIEMALRLVGAGLICLASDPETWQATDRIFLRRFVAAHADHLTAFPSRYSSANNHLIAEGLGLLVAGLVMPDRLAWAAEGRQILEQEALRQIYPDGVGAEQSPTYQAFSMEMLALSVLLARETGRPLAAQVTERLVAGARFLRALMDDRGRVPAIGDDDEGRVIGQPPDREPRYVASIVAAVAALAERPDLMPPDRDRHLRDALFGVVAPSAPLATGRQTFARGGYTTSRARIAGRIATLVFDHGPLGYLSLCAHGHADALAVWLTVDEQPVLVDSGTYLYFAGGARRTRFRESLAHNTLSIAGSSQSIAAPGFSWIHRAAAGLDAEDAERARWSVSGWHDGYSRRFGVRHERRIVESPQGFTIEDRLVGSAAPHACEIRFLVPQDLDLHAGDGAVLLTGRGQPLCRLVAPSAFVVSIEDGERSTRFGQLEPARRVVFSGRNVAGNLATGIEILGTTAARIA